MHPIGSDPWWRALRGLGVRREAVEALLPAGEIDGHALPHGDTPAERLALLFLAFVRTPTYAVLMYVPHQWSKGRSLREWIVAQYASVLVHGSPAEIDQALYSLWVDVFEIAPRASFVYPRLARMLPRGTFAAVLAHSGPVPWATKRASYQRAALDVTQHAALARGLHGSFYDVFGSVVPAEARALFHAIHVRDERIRAELAAVIAVPARWQVRVLVTVDDTDPRWTRWIDARRRERPSFLALLRRVDGPRAWIPEAEVVHRGEIIGRLVHLGFPFDRDIAHRVLGDWRTWMSEDPDAGLLFRIEGDVERMRVALDDVVDVWPWGLYVEPGN